MPRKRVSPHPEPSGERGDGYEPDTHPAKLKELMSNGKNYPAFCAFAGIGETTFYRWIDTYAELDKAYTIGKMLAQYWWEDKMQTHLVTGEFEKFNNTGWSMVMRNRFNFTEHRKVKIPKLSKAETFSQKFELLAVQIEHGNLTGNESSQLAAVLVSGVKIAESSEMIQRIELLEAMLSRRIEDESIGKEEA